MAFPHPTRLLTLNADQTVLQLQPMSDTALYTLTVTPLSERLFEDAVRFVATEYCRREPLLVSLQRGTGKSLTPDELLPVLRTQWKDHVRSSFVALSAENETGAAFDTTTTNASTTMSSQRVGLRESPKAEAIMGVCLCRPFAPSASRLSLPPSSNSVLLLYDQLQSVSTQAIQRADTRERVTPASGEEAGLATGSLAEFTCLEIGVLAVDPFVANRCVASGLLSRALAYAQASHYRTVRVTCSNHFLHKALIRFGFSSERTLPLAPEDQESQMDLTENEPKFCPAGARENPDEEEEAKDLHLNGKEDVLRKATRCMSVVYPHTHLRLMHLALAK